MSTKTELTFDTFQFRTASVELLMQRLGIDKSVARSYVIKLIRAGRLTETMKETAVKNTLNTFVQEILAASNGVQKPDTPPPSDPATEAGETGDQRSQQPETAEEAQPETGTPEVDTLQVPAKASGVSDSKPPEMSSRLGELPIGQLSGARVWRHFGGEDLEFWVSGKDVATLKTELEALFSITTPCAWIEKRLAAEEAYPVLKPGDLYTYEGQRMITSIVAKTDRFEGRVTTKIEFWSERPGALTAEFTPIYTDDLAEQIGTMLGEEINTRTELIGKFRLTVKLGKLQDYKKETTLKNGVVKKIGDLKDPRYPGSYWQEFVSIERIND